MNQGKLELVKWVMARVNIDILGISELKWTGMGEFNSDDHYMATHSSVLAWRIPGTGEPGGLPSVGSHRVGHNGSDLAAAAAACMHVYTSVHIHLN